MLGSAQFSNSIRTMWKSISYKDAKRHPLYGIKGWALFLWLSLVIFAPGVMVGYYVYVGSLIDQYPSDTIRQLDDLDDFLLLSVFFITMAYWFLGYKLWTKEPNFQSLYTWIVIGLGVASIFVLEPYGLTLFPTSMENLSFGERYSGLSKEVFYSVVWIIYVWKSKRINVTCAHRVRENDPIFIELMNAKSRQKTDAKSEPTPRSSEVVRAKPDQPVIISVSPNATDDDLYAIAWKEVENNDQDKGLWARLYAEHSGNDELLKTAYLKLRVEELSKQREIEKNKPPPPGKFEDLSKARGGIESIRKDRGEASKVDVEKETPHLYIRPDTTKKWIFFGFKFRYHPLIWFFGIIFTVVIVANLIN